jgi:hypothetical protein
MGTAGVFPSGVGEQFEYLWNQVVNLHHKWRFYLDLFDNRDADEVINERLPGSFRIIEECVRTDMVITLYRLNDKAVLFEGKKNEKRNLTLRSLLKQVVVHRPAEVSDLTTQLDDLDSHLNTLKEHRNTNFGHTDRDTALGTRATPPERLERTHIEDSAKMAAAFLNCVEELFGVSPTIFAFSKPLGGGKDLIESARRGWQHQEDEVIKFGVAPRIVWRPQSEA